MESPQFCAQENSCASSNESTRCKGSSGEIMWKNWKRYRHGSWRKSETITRWSMKQGMRAGKVILRHWWIFVISRIRSWRRNFKNTEGRAVLRGDIVKDDSGSYAVFTEQGSSASQMTAAKIMDIISRLPGCDGQAADAVSAYTQVKMEDAPTFWIPKSECPDIWIRLPRHNWPKSWSSMEDTLTPWAKFVRSSSGTTIVGKALRESSFGKRAGKKFQSGNVYSLIGRKDYSCLCTWTTSKWQENKIWIQCGKY